jgi:hypothetical protein
MKLSERMDAKIAQLKENTVRSRRVTAEVFGTSAELLQDQALILQDLSLPTPSLRKSGWTIFTLKREFKTFKMAQRHFKEIYGIRANSWSVLEERINIIENTLIHLGIQERFSN